MLYYFIVCKFIINLPYFWPMDALFEEERKARVESDTAKLMDIHNQIMDSCAGDDDTIHALRMLMNKRGQDHSSIQSIVSKLLKDGRSVDFYVRLLKETIEGKIYLENERLEAVNLVKALAGPNLLEYYDIIKEVPVETFTTISDSKIHEFIFEQLRIALLACKYNDAEIISRKVRKSYLSKEELVIFLNYMVILRANQQKYVGAADILFELNEVDPLQKHVVLASFYSILSSCLTEGMEITDSRLKLLSKAENDKFNDPIIRTIVSKFNSKIIIDFSVINILIERIKTLYGNNPVIFKDYIKEMKYSISEHNFKVLNGFVSKIHMKYLCELMNLTEDETVEFISDMVNEGYSGVRINQQDGMVNFGAKSWTQDVSKMLDKIVEVSVLIHKDEIINK